MIYNIIATCRNETCEVNGIENFFESEDSENIVVLCGPCQVYITDIIVVE